MQRTLRTLGLRAAELKKRQALMPQSYIPELQFINEKDWLDAVAGLESLQSENDFRKALSSLRASAKGKLGNRVHDALRKYAEANGDALPTDMNQLQPYFDQPLDPAVLQRYEIIPDGGKYAEAGDRPLVREVAPPVDDEYDTRYTFHRNGTSSRSYNAVNDAIEAAATAYAEANNGLLPRQAAQLAGYLKPGIDPNRVSQFLSRIPPNVNTLEELKRR